MNNEQIEKTTLAGVVLSEKHTTNSNVFASGILVNDTKIPTLSATGRYQQPQNSTGFKETPVQSVHQLQELARSDWAPMVFRNGERRAENFLHSYFLFGDIDNTDEKSNCSIEQFRELFEGTEYYILTSRNHRKAKNGKPEADRFHVLFPVSTPYSDSASFSKDLTAIVDTWKFFDPSCKDAARFFFGNKDLEVFHHDGKELDVPSWPSEANSLAPTMDPPVDSSKPLFSPIGPEWEWKDGKQTLLEGLYRAASSGVFDSYDKWLTLGAALKHEGYTAEDWEMLSHPGKDHDIPAKWDSFKETRATGGSLVSFIREVDPAFWRSQPTETKVPPTPATPQSKPSLRFPIKRYSDMTYRNTNWIIKGYVEEESLFMIFGPSGVGKSFLILDWLQSVAVGRPWNGHNTKKGSVLYCYGEGGNGLMNRLKAWDIVNGCPDPDRQLFTLNIMPILNDGLQVAEAIKAIEEQMAGTLPTVIVFDTMNRAYGGDENSTSDMTAFRQGCDIIRQYFHCAVGILHHSGYAAKERSRGSSVMIGALDHCFQVSKEGETGLRLSTNKMKDHAPPKPMAFVFATVELGISDEEGEEIKSAVLRLSDLKEDKTTVPTGKNQVGALQILRKELSKQDDGDDSRPMIPVSKWAALCREQDIDKDAFFKAKKLLQRKLAIDITDGLVSLN